MEKKPESIFINRELSWLDFDSRVLALAKEKTVPLGERIKFAAIFGSNMDEFFMVRVGSLYDQTLLKNNKTDNVTHMTAAEQIAAMIGCGEVDMLLFFRDPVGAKPGEPNDMMLLRLCDMHTIPVATNIATAEVLIHGLERGDLAWIELQRGRK